MVLLWILWAIDIMVALVFFAFFFIGIADGSVSSFNIVLWLGVLGALTALVLGVHALAGKGRMVLATVLAAVPAVPAVLYALLMALAVMTGARWN
jgi:hypothetical protein